MATAQKGVKVSKIAAAVVAHTSENPGTKPETVKLSTEITARMLTACETAGLLAANDESHKSKQSELRGKLWSDLAKLANELGLAKFVEYWNAVKPELKKPENAAKFGAMPDQKSQGKYNISEYLTQCVSRIRGAMTHKIKVVVKGVPVPQSKLAARIAEANKLAAEKKRNDPASSTYDKHYELRVKISARLVEIAGIVRKGSHSAGVLKQVDTVLGRIADSLKNDKSGDAEEETETAEKQAA
jgi:hypothetical protein